METYINKINISSKYKLIKLWEIAKLKAWGTPRRGKDEFWKGWDINWLKSWELKDSLKIIKISEKITEKWLKQSSATLFEKWTLLIAMYWVTAWEVWILWVDSTTNQAVCSIIPKIEINKNYIFWILIFLRKKIRSETFWGAQPNISKNYLENLKIPLPPLEIQNQIVEKMDRALEIKKQKEKEAKQLLEGIDDFVLGELGIEYEEVEEKKVFGVMLSELGENKRFDSFYNDPKFLELEKRLEGWKYEIKKVSDFLVSRSWSVWIIALVKKEFKGFAFGSFMIKFSLNSSNLISKEYVQFWLNNKLNQNLIEQEKIWAIQWNITIDTIKNFKIPLPPLEVQEKIANEVKSRIERAEVLGREAREVYEEGKRGVEEMVLGE